MNLKGISIAELLIVMAVIVILAAIGFLNLSGYRAAQDLDFDAKKIVSALRDVQQKSIIQEEDKKWGVSFVNLADDYYVLFKESLIMANIVVTVYLKTSIEIDEPAAGLTVVFEKISGLITAPATIKIKIKGANCSLEEERCKTININANGTITL